MKMAYFMNQVIMKTVVTKIKLNKAVTRCLLRLQETLAQLQKLSVSVQLLPKTLLGSCLISDLKANKADRSMKFVEEVAVIRATVG